MDINLSSFHFLRPAWLALIPLAVLLPLLWRGNQQARQQRSNIAPHLLAHLWVTGETRQRLRPIHLACALLALGAIAAAGPSWEQDRPDFLDNKAALILAVDLSPSMDASDVSPTRLEAAKQKINDLTQRRRGSRTGLIAYAGSAHLVLPPTDDPALLGSFVQALGSDLIQRPGKNVEAVWVEAQRLLKAESEPATLLLITDGADTSQLSALEKQPAAPALQVLILAVGSQDGGVIRDAKGQPRLDSNGRPLLARFDAAALKQLASALDAPLGSLTLNDDDLDWIELHAQAHFQSASDTQQLLHWKDAGYWLVWPLLVMAFFCLRRGWSLNWAAMIVLGLSLQPVSSQAAGLVDAFFTPDQQGRWAFEHQHYPAAAEHFRDAYWKGIAAYQASDYDLALASFARLDTPQAYFYLGNIYTRRYQFDRAIAAYDRAIALQAGFPEAIANRALAIALQQDTASAAQNAPETQADNIKMDLQADKGQGKTLQVQQASTDALWLQNLSTSPAGFLRQKFSVQDQRAVTEGRSP
jgi:Ca-activated chloride channel family protein